MDQFGLRWRSRGGERCEGVEGDVNRSVVRVLTIFSVFLTPTSGHGTTLRQAVGCFLLFLRVVTRGVHQGEDGSCPGIVSLGPCRGRCLVDSLSSSLALGYLPPHYRGGGGAIILVFRPTARYLTLPRFFFKCGKVPPSGGVRSRSPRLLLLSASIMCPRAISLSTSADKRHFSALASFFWRTLSPSSAVLITLA